jgi:glycine/D-amino acid oxidase-like deaminating enzyme/nitrite reductase/ring-hydroxylating ferredoxin subunit
MAIHQSYWNATAAASNHPALAGDIEADVAIVGGGIVGVTAARFLADQGMNVALVEAARIGEGVTGGSTAKITSQHNIAYTTIERKFGADGARLYAEANEAGLRTIAELAERHGIACDLERRPAFAYTLDDKEVSRIEEEVAAARRLGLPAALTRDTGLPFAVKAAMRWDDQAQFHPVKYVKGLAASLPGGTCRLFENSRVTDWDPHRIATAAGSVKARHVVMATHLPLGQIGLFYAENYPHMHAVIMGRAEPGRVPPGMYISVESPRHSMRGHRDEAKQDWMIFTGPSFKHGDVAAEREGFAEIEGFAMRHFGVAADYRWTNEDYNSMDHVPYVGRSSSFGDAYYVATGFNAWGITNGTAAAMLLADMIAGRDNGWLELFDATRIKPIAGAKEFASGTAATAGHLIGGYLSRKPHEFDAVGRGEGKVLKIDGRNVAAWRDDQGEVHAVSAVCTHMGCLVGWNETDRSWDCPCHGSRFAADGAVLHGPAVTPLAPVGVAEEAEA